jgi:hypothetical protein
MSVTMQSCDVFSRPDLERMSQAELHLLINRITSIELLDRDKVENAFTDGGRDPTVWFEIKFDDERKTQIPASLAQLGYKMKDGLISDLPRPLPPEIATWWDLNKLSSSTLFILRRQEDRDDADGVWCFFDAVHGKILGCNFSY